MILLELALQGVKGYPASAKVALRPGYNVLLGVTKTPLARLFELLFYEGEEIKPVVELIAGAGQASRAGLTLQGRDNVTYRLVADFASGSRALLKMDPATQKFVSVSEVGREIGQFLRGQLGLPPRKMFTDMFVTALSALPSKTTRAAVAAAASQAKSEKQGWKRDVDVQDLSTDPNELRATLEKLKNEIAVARDFVAAQDKVGDLQQEIAQTEAELAPLRQIESQERDLDMELGKYAAAQSLPAGIEDRIKKLSQFQQRRDDAVARIARDREQLTGLVEFVPPPFWTDSKFWASALGGLGVIALGLVLGDEWRRLALLDVPAFGAAGFFAWKWVSEAEQRDGLQLKLASLDEREKIVEREYIAAVTPVRDAEKALGVHEPSLILDILQQRDDARAAFDAKKREIEEARNGPFAAPLQRWVKAREELKAAEAIIAAQGYTRDPSEVERDIERHETALGQMVGQKLQNVDQLFDAKFVAGEDDRARELLGLAADLFVTKVDEIGKAVGARLAQYLTALTGRKFVSGAVDASGLLVLSDPQGRTIPFSALAAAERDEVWLALKLTLLERYLSRHKLPLYFDDPFAGLDDARRTIAAKMLKYLGSLSQVIQTAEHPAFAGSADQAVRLQ